MTETPKNTVTHLDENQSSVTTTVTINLLGGIISAEHAVTDVFTHDGVGSVDYETKLIGNGTVAAIQLSALLEGSAEQLKKVGEELVAKGLVQQVNLAALSAPAGAAAGTSVTGSGAGAVAGAMNGAAVGGDWIQLENRFGGAPIEAPSLNTVSTQMLKDLCREELKRLGLDPDKFSAWDERTTGKAVGAIVNVKVDRDHEDLFKTSGLKDNAKTVMRLIRWNTATNKPVFQVTKDWEGLLQFAKGGPFAAGASDQD